MKVVILTTDGRDLTKEYLQRLPDFGTAPEALFEGFALLPDVEVHVVSCLRKPVVSPEKLAPNIFYHSLLVPKAGWMTTGYQGCIRAVRRKVRELRPDIVHGQGTERENAMCAAFSGFPNVVTIHGNMAELARLFDEPPGSYNWLAGHFEDFALRRTAGVFCNSAYTSELVMPRAKKTWLVPNPVRSVFLQAQPCATLEQPPILLNIGVITPRKRQLDLLALAGDLHRRGCRFQIQFIGRIDSTSRYGSVFQEDLKAAESAGYAAWPGPKNVTDLIRCMDTASALAHIPSEESFGLVVAEALARNLKFFGFRTGGIPNIATGVEGAEVMPEGYWRALADRIAHWLETGAKKPATADETMRRRYHPRVIAQRHLDIYNEILGGGSESA